jgi:hypothetical protein
MYEYTQSWDGLGQEATEEPQDARFQTVTTPEGTFERVALKIMGPTGLWQDCHCYRNFPRDMVAPRSRPWSMEFDTGALGDRFSCQCDVVMQCPPEMRPIPYAPDYKAKKRECDSYQARAKTMLAAAQRDIEDEGFRGDVAMKIARAAGVPEWRLRFVEPAEFLTVLEERSRRERGIWVLSTITIAAGGGYLLWKYLRARRGEER